MKSTLSRALSSRSTSRIPSFFLGPKLGGNAGSDSDIDLLVISDREKELPRPHRGRELRRKLAKTLHPFDLLIYTREKFEKYRYVPQSFSATVMREGVVLYGH